MRSMVVACVLFVVGCSGPTSSIPTPAIGPAVPTLGFTVVGRETQMKGASLNPPAPGKYTTWVVKAALTDPQTTLTKELVSATLARLLQETRAEANRIDGVTVFLYQSAEHANGANAALGRAEWWPKGHSFDPRNEQSIINKSTYVETVDVFDLPAEPVPATEPSRLAESVRHEIFAALVRSQDRATREAEAKYPTDTTNIPLERIRSYDFKTAITKNANEDERLRIKYEKELLKQFKISEAELEVIQKEAFARKWPLPRSGA